jgi:hypothetical protein
VRSEQALEKDTQADARWGQGKIHKQMPGGGRVS